MKVLYITYIDFDKSKSGSSVRPQKMYKAFLDKGMEVKLLKCQQNRLKDRTKEVLKILKWIGNNKPDFCYIESPSGPIFNYLDLLLIKKINRKKIPVAYFYRDLFWLFSEKTKELKGVKKYIILALNKLTAYYVKKYCDIVYVPSKSVQKMFNDIGFMNVKLLPPATDIVENKNHKEMNTCIYVGGISHAYGSDILVDAFKLINKAEDKYKLELICRENEYREFFNQGLNYSWLNVHHVEGDALGEYYSRAYVGIIPVRKTPYSNVAISVKLYEYIGNGLPIITTNTEEMSRIVEENNLGVVCEDNAESLAAAIKKYFDEEQFNCFRECVDKARYVNKWTDRADQIAFELLNIEGKHNGKS